MGEQMKWCLVLALLACLPGGVIEANEEGRVPAGRVAWQLVGKTLINPATGTGQVLAYFTFLEGIPGPMFAGSPGESTAFFTLRSEPFSLQTFPNGDVLIGLLGTEVFTLYLDTTPDQDFSDPPTFSDGEPLATFNRLPAELIFVGPVFTDDFSVEFVSSRRFVWQGRRFNLRRLTPEGVTLTVTGSTAFLPSGVAEFPVSVSFGASAIAVEVVDEKDEE